MSDTSPRVSVVVVAEGRYPLDEIYHDASETPGTARISLIAELIDPAGRTVIARHTFKRSAPAASYDAPGAVQAFRQALAALLDEVVAWVDAEASPKPGEAPKGRRE